MSELQDLLGIQPPRPVQPQLTHWDRGRQACFYVGLASFSCLVTQLARVIPPLTGVICIGMGAGLIGLFVWALFTPGDQRLSISLAALAKFAGVALGLWDAAEILQLIGVRHWLAAGAILVILAFVFMSEARSNGRKA